jgi:uncharacterized protein (DUF1697 family)
MSRYAALLRGVNVGGKNMLPMKELVVLFEQAGCTAVSSYIQSGNVVFSAPAAVAKKVPEVVGAQITRKFGFAAPIVVRGADALARIALANPFLAAGASLDAVYVSFLAKAPTAAQIASLDPNRSPPDAFAVQGTEVYLHCPNGFGRTKLTSAYLDGKLGTVSTARNWRTLLKLVEMTAGRTA